MKKSLSTILMSLFLVWSFANSDLMTVYKELKDNKEYVSGLKPSSGEVYIKSAYGSDSLYNLNYSGLFSGLHILEVSLVYSNYVDGGNLSQGNINLERLKKLQAYDSTIISDRSISWKTEIIESATNMDEAKAIFHGFIIKTANNQEDFLSKIVEGSYSLSDYMSQSGAMIHVYSKESETYEASLDLAIINTFDRNQNWKDMLIVTDLTGSMMAYSAQLLLWLKLNDKNPRAKSFAFFNDGDSTPDIDKVIGETGGIYYTDYEELSDVLIVAKETSKNGGGGDGEENDLEALLKGMELSEGIGEIVLIADNGIGPKDMALLSQIDKPIRVILCRSHIPLHPDYLNLAKATGGSVHTIDDDLDHLMVVNEGEIITLNKTRYLIKDGKFQYYSE